MEKRGGRGGWIFLRLILRFLVGKRRLTVSCHGPGHADFSVRKGEDFSAVGEGHGTLAGRVEGGEDEDEERHERDVRSARLVDQETAAGDEQTPGHVGEGEEQQAAAAKFVDGPYGGPGEGEVREPEAPGEEEGVGLVEAGLGEDGGAVEGDDVDS